MCIDFTDLNRSCPKDCYPLPSIDQIVSAIVGFEVLCFIDTYKGYHQILMNPADAEKTTFVTNRGTFYYKKMPFGLKNAGATYQRLVNQIFKGQIGRNLEVYIGDMVIKSNLETGMLDDLRETFSTLREVGLKLNPEKCVFRISS